MPIYADIVFPSFLTGVPVTQDEPIRLTLFTRLFSLVYPSMLTYDITYQSYLAGLPIHADIVYLPVLPCRCTNPCCHELPTGYRCTNPGNPCWHCLPSCTTLWVYQFMLTLFTQRVYQCTVPFRPDITVFTHLSWLVSWYLAQTNSPCWQKSFKKHEIHQWLTMLDNF